MTRFDHLPKAQMGPNGVPISTDRTPKPSAAIVRWWRNVAYNYKRNEAAWTTTLGKREVSAGFFRGFGLALVVFDGDLELVIGPFSFGVVG